MASSVPPPPPSPASGWAVLPRDILWSVFTELGQREILSGAGLVCTAWWHFARHDPALWRRIDLTVPEDDTVEADVDDDGEFSEEESSEEESFFSLFDDDLPAHHTRQAKTPAAMDEISEEGESIFSLFDDLHVRTYQDKTPAAMETDVVEEDDVEDLSDESLSDESPIDEEETPATDENKEKDGSPTDEEDDDTEEDDGSPTDEADGDTEEDDDDGDLGSESSLEDDSPICQVKIPVKDGSNSSVWKAMALAAIDRSAGQCEAFWGRADDEVLLYLADRASSMKSLRLTSHYDVSSKVFTELIKKFPLLEELELVLKFDAYNYKTNSKQRSTNSWVELFHATCEACSHLHYFTVHNASKEQRSNSYYLRERMRPTHFSIPMMQNLRSLELSGDSFTVDVVMQIVDKCPNLESLDISNVPYLYRLDENYLRNKCSRLKDLRLPAAIYYSSSDDDMS